MHIILGLLGVLGAVAVFVWRINQATNAARELADTAGEFANLPRKMRFRRKAGKGGVDVIDDPREAGAVLVYGAASYAGALDNETKQRMASEFAALFDLEMDSARELTARAAWHVGSVNDPVNLVNPLADRLVQEVGRDACAELTPLIREAAGENPQGRYFADKFRRRCGLS